MATRKKSVSKKRATEKKKPFMPMEMAKVELNQDQAVLTCCDTGGRDMRWAEVWQCYMPPVCGEGDTAAISS